MKRFRFVFGSIPRRMEEKIGHIKPTLPTAPMALTYVQLLAKGFSSQCLVYKGARVLLEEQCLPQMDTCSGGKTLGNPY